ESQRQKIEAAALDGAFEQIVFAREAGGEKPAPAAFREVARRLGLAPGALAMVGDNPWRDVAGALDAHYGIAYGIRRLGALSSFDERLFRRVQASGLPYRMLDGLQPLLVFLEGRGGR
ncbi:MAG TPA: HAD-IA family hydrolase, partial [Solirubrobacterales bacterium]|nr:HAD-IA family hydrolase [Solirubrobacterales bacterium]